jgi:hypothetical protein
MNDFEYDLSSALSGLDALDDIAHGRAGDDLLFDYQFGAELNHVFALLHQHAPEFAAELGGLGKEPWPKGYDLREKDLSIEVRAQISTWRSKYLLHPYRDDPRVRTLYPPAQL